MEKGCLLGQFFFIAVVIILWSGFQVCSCYVSETVVCIYIFIY